MNNENTTESTFANFRREIQTLNYVELNYLISDIILEIKKRSYNEGMVKAMTSGISAEAIAPTKSDQQGKADLSRDEIIEKAKRDITDLGRKVSPASMALGYRIKAGRLKEIDIYRTCYARFIVNKEKRTVVVLLREHGTDILSAKGIAKCDPSDCFNVHIGKAIALRRALGLEVPSEYLTVPQPTEVRIGDVVRSLMSGTIGTKVESEEGKHTLINDGIYYTLAHSACDVIDDSRENIGGDEVTE